IGRTRTSGGEIPYMRSRLVAAGLAANLAAAMVAAIAPAGAATASNVGAASVYGLTKNFKLVGHTDLYPRGMNSPIAVAGQCVYVGDRYYSQTSTEAGRPNGGIAIIDA